MCGSKEGGEELEAKMQSVSQVSAPLGRVPPLTVKEFQAVTATPPILLRRA